MIYKKKTRMDKLLYQEKLWIINNLFKSRNNKDGVILKNNKK